MKASFKKQRCTQQTECDWHQHWQWNPPKTCFGTRRCRGAESWAPPKPRPCPAAPRPTSRRSSSGSWPGTRRSPSSRSSPPRTSSFQLKTGARVLSDENGRFRLNGARAGTFGGRATNSRGRDGRTRGWGRPSCSCGLWSPWTRRRAWRSGSWRSVPSASVGSLFLCFWLY